METTPNPIIVPMTVESTEQIIPLTADTNVRPMPNITIGTVETGDEAEATMTGTSTNPVLNLVLPRGEQGEQGERGPQGNPTTVNGKSGENITLTAEDVGAQLAPLIGQADDSTAEDYVTPAQVYAALEEGRDVYVTKGVTIAYGSTPIVFSVWSTLTSGGVYAQMLWDTVVVPHAITLWGDNGAWAVFTRALADSRDVPTALSQLNNDVGYITEYTETDPTVPAWAKAATKPTYTAAEVGAQKEPLVGQAYDSSAANYITPQQVYDALKAGQDVSITYVDSQYGALVIDTWNIADTLDTIAASVILKYNTLWLVYELDGVLPSTWTRRVGVLVDGDVFDATVLRLDGRIDGKQDIISDLDTIRSGAEAGATAVQSVNSQTGTAITLGAVDVGAIPSSEKGSANGVAELDANGLVPSSQLPAFVDDVLEYASRAQFPATGETGKIYVDTSTNITYRWSGSTYVEISPSLALGETSSTAYRGDRGKAAYDHAQAHGSAFANGLYKITTNSEGHVTAATPANSSDITGALGFTPYNSTNPSGYVNATQAANAAPVQSVNGKTGAVALSASDVGALPNTTAIPTKTSDLTNDSDFISESAVDSKIETKADSAGASANYAAKLTASIPYGECDSTSTATEFTATVPGITELKDGVCVLLKNGVVTSAANFTLNINGLGAKGAYSNMAAATRETTTFNVNYTILFIYDETRVEGGCWIYYRGYYSDTNSIGYQIRTNSSRLPAADRVGRYRLLFTSADNTHWVPGNTSDSTSATSAKTVNQRPINPLGPIRYYGYTTVVAANSMPAATYMWQQYVVTLGYTFTPITLNDFAPLYLKCAPQSDGSAIIDATTPVVQTLPSSADGMIYVYLGIATSTTAFELSLEHPVYEYKDGKIREWSNAYVPTKTSELTNDSGFLTNYTETDPTVPAWAKASTKPTYTASEVGAAEEPLIVHATAISGTDYYQLDKTPAQINVAINAGQYVAVQTVDATFPYITSTNVMGDTLIVFGASLLYDGTIKTTGFVVIQAQGVGMVINATNFFVSSINGYDGGDVTLTASDVGALPDTTAIPTKTSDLTNDSGYITLADLPIWNGGVS